MAGYHVENFGCRASQADGASISAELRQRGILQADDFRTADVLVLNTCSVTEEADRDARSFLRKAQRANPQARVVVTGCYAQRASDEVAALPGVRHVIGNSHKALVAEIAAGLAEEGATPPVSAQLQEPTSFFPVANLLRSAPIQVDENFAHAEMAFLDHSGWSGVTRPNLKVQDGCGNRCSFCVIPQTRGNSRSMTLERVLGHVERFVAHGGQEMVLSGINLGRWGRDHAIPQRLEELVEAILVRTQLRRMRISSVEPMDWTDHLLELYRAYGTGDHPRLARHAHLPLQSGSDSILRAMYRRYRPWHYGAKLEAIRAALPDAAVGGDVMVGFPGETDQLFEETYRFIEQQPFTYLHLFPFSARPGTPAWLLQKQMPVAPEAVRLRMGRLRALIEAKNARFREQFLGKVLSIVTLQSESVGARTRAISDNFLTVEAQPGLAANRMLSVRVDGLTATGLRGRHTPPHRHDSPAVALADEFSSLVHQRA